MYGLFGFSSFWEKNFSRVHAAPAHPHATKVAVYPALFLKKML